MDMAFQQAMDRLQKQYAAFIRERCMSGDREADHGKGDEVIIMFLRTISCDDLADAWEKVEKLYA